MRPESPPERLLAWYGDDMTGSFDVLGALASAGLRGVLSLQAPSVETARRFPQAEAIGWAGNARTLPVAEVREVAAAAARAMLASGARILHYKICSTFDSSPETGSVGAAIDSAQMVVDSDLVPVLAAAPRLGRWTAFSNLFARSGPESPAYRLDRHPTMRSHPITPMHESDIRLVLAEQTTRPIGTVDLSDLGGGIAAVETRLAELGAAGIDTVVFDAVDEADVALVARLIWERAAARPELVFASSGLEHGLDAIWERSPGGTVLADGLDDAPIALAVCGSRSPVSDAQIARAVAAGWEEVPLRLDGGGPVAAAAAEGAQQAATVLAAGRSAIVHTAGGRLGNGAPAPARIAGLGAAGRDALGDALGDAARAAIELTGVRRLAVAGGDSSGRVLRRLGVEAVEAIATFAPAMPFCRPIGEGPAPADLELILKGGQTGASDFFEEARLGRPAPVAADRALA